MAFLIFAFPPSYAFASGKLYYGSRVGMQVSVISIEGPDTKSAVIRTKHTREDAIAFCREYVGKVTERCVREELNIPLNDQISADCISGTFTDFFGTHYQFKGLNADKDAMARYLVVNLDTGEAADGSSASGYSTNLGIFRALCPRRSPPIDRE